MDTLSLPGVTGALRLFNEQADLIGQAVTNVEHGVGAFANLRVKRAAKKRFRSLLKMMSELAPGSLPSYVVEVDGFSDNELSELLRLDPHLYYQAVASLLEKDDIGRYMATRLSLRLSELDPNPYKHPSSSTAPHMVVQDGVPFTHVAWTSMFDATDLGNEALAAVGTEVRAAMSGNESGYRRMVNDARTSLKVDPIYDSVQIRFLTGTKDELRRCEVTSAVLLDEASGFLLVFRNGVWFREDYDLDGSTMGLRLKSFETERVHDLNVVLTVFHELETLMNVETRIEILRECLGVICRARKTATSLRVSLANKVFIPSVQTLKRIAEHSDESVRDALLRTFSVVDEVLRAMKEELTDDVVITSADLKFFVERDTSEPAAKVISRYQMPREGEIKSDSKRDGEAGIFATYIYGTHGDNRVAEKYDALFMARKICHRFGNSGHLVAVPYAEKVMMCTNGMHGENVEYYNNQVFEELKASRILFLPVMLISLGIASNAELNETFVHEFQSNPLLVTDPFSQNVLATMRRLLERKVIDVAKTQQMIVSKLGEPGHQVARELIALVARLGAVADPKYAARSCFYDITVGEKNYGTGPIVLKFTGGMTLHGMVPRWLPRSGLIHFGSWEVDGKRKAVTAKVDPKDFVRLRNPLPKRLEGKAALLGSDDSGAKFVEEYHRMSGELDGPTGYFSGVLHLDVKIGEFPPGIPVQLRNAYAEGGRVA